jgi:FAD/FMN-containing dehydrogenase
VHVNLLGLDAEDESLDEAVLRLAAELGGTISAEHGVGFAKAEYLFLCRSEGEIDAMRRLKRALDPSGILAPGRILGFGPASGRVPDGERGSVRAPGLVYAPEKAIPPS